MKTQRPGIVDPALFGLGVLITLLGMVIIFDAGYARSMATGKGLVPAEFTKQGIFFLLSMGVFAVSMLLNRDTLKKLAKPFMWLCFGSLIAVELIGKVQNGARRWISLGPLGDIQPAEFAKLAIVLYLAAALANKSPWPTEWPKRWKQNEWLMKVAIPKIERIWPAVVAVVLLFLIEREKDLGTGAIVFFTAVVMILSVGISKKSLLIGTTIVVMGGGFMVMKESYRMDRIMNHLAMWDPKNVDDTGFQSCQSQLAMASGGLTGVGIGNGRAKYILPATTTDFVMATVGEEFGVLGPVALLGLVGAMCWRMWTLAQRSADTFSKLVLMGVAWWFGIQACTNLMMANAFLPAIGIPFPFISSGGSSLLALWLAIGICQIVAAPSAAEEGSYASGRNRWGNGRARVPGA